MSNLNETKTKIAQITKRPTTCTTMVAYTGARAHGCNDHHTHGPPIDRGAMVSSRGFEPSANQLFKPASTAELTAADRADFSRVKNSKSHTRARSFLSAVPTTFDTELRKRTNSSDLTADLTTWLGSTQCSSNRARRSAPRRWYLSICVVASARAGPGLRWGIPKKRSAKNGQNLDAHYQNCERPTLQSLCQRANLRKARHKCAPIAACGV